MEIVKGILLYVVLIALGILFFFSLKIIVTVLIRSYMFIMMAFVGALFIYELLKSPLYIIKDFPNIIKGVKDSTFYDLILGIIAFFITIGVLIAHIL